MFSLLRWYVSGATLLQLAAELVWLCIAGVLAVYMGGARPLANTLMPALLLAILLVSMNGMFGLYRHAGRLKLPMYVGRLLLAMIVGAPLVYAATELLPGGDHFQHHLVPALALGFCGLVLVRHIVISPALRTLRPHRVLVLGTGWDASSVENSLAAMDSPGIQLVGFYPLGKVDESVVSARLIVDGSQPLEALVRELRVTEIVVAVRQQRGGVLPLNGLLECRLAGVQITDIARFFEP